MEKHITLVGILNIVYRSIILVLALVVLALVVLFGQYAESCLQWGSHGSRGIPVEVLGIVTMVISTIAFISTIVSVAGIIGSIGVLNRKSWGRITLLVVSFLNLLHIPLGTALGAYSIWVLMNDEIIRLMDQPTIVPVINRPA